MLRKPYGHTITPAYIHRKIRRRVKKPKTSGATFCDALQTLRVHHYPLPTFTEKFDGVLKDRDLRRYIL